MKTLPVHKSAWLIGLIVLALAQSACNYATQLINKKPVPHYGTPIPAGCENKYLPARLGAAWTMAGAGYTNKFTVANLSDTSFDEKVLAGPTNGEQASFDDHWRCTTDGLEMTGTGIAVYTDVKGVIVPTSINPGDQWSQTARLNPTSFTDNFTAIGEESVTVPAGTFTAMKIQRSSLQQQGDPASGLAITIKTEGFEWWAAGVGPVKTSLTYTTNKSSHLVERELQSYNIP